MQLHKCESPRKVLADSEAFFQPLSKEVNMQTIPEKPRSPQLKILDLQNDFDQIVTESTAVLYGFADEDRLSTLSEGLLVSILWMIHGKIETLSAIQEQQRELFKSGVAA